MKLLRSLLPFAAMLLLGAAAPLRAQKLGAEDITPVYDLVKTFKRLIPYRDTANHLTITHVLMSTDYRYIKLTVFYDADQNPDSITPYHTLHYLVDNDQWSLQPLADHTFDLRLTLSFRDHPVSKTHSFTTADLQETLNPSAKTFLAQVARNIVARLPITLSDDGETMVRCHYDPKANLFTNVYQYSDSTWPAIKTFITDSTQRVRYISASHVLADTNGLPEAVIESEATLSYHYLNQSHTDSLVVNIAPWMWEPLAEQFFSSVEPFLADSVGDSSSYILSLIAHNVDKACPQAVDSLTTMLSCRFDPVNRVMTYTYRVDELAMLNMESNAESQSRLLSNIEQVLVSEAGRPLAELLVAVQAAVVYHYSSPHSRSPLTFTVTPARLAELLAP